ncbi:putative membrane protein [Propionispora sp. 2/2-37]|uniref:hypothetical protein n=1 Tax=Propionispora sp. 2/2-37 TaxID=1677858 RepID=UPI0006BB5ECE|nr:hypothetical protein [Propionispora sp. 2/2-37]CUH96900.1 putative membrane protein [Propionispora sp. 2/2-37]
MTYKNLGAVILSLWAAVCLGGALGIILFFFIFRRFRGLERQIEFLTVKVTGRGNRRRQKPDEELLNRIYGFVLAGITKRNDAIIYKATELLKTAFGEALVRDNEPVRLMGLIARAIHFRQYQAAVVILDAFRPLILHLPAQCLPVATEQLTLIAAMAFRIKQNFLLSKVTELVFFLFENKIRLQSTATFAVEVLKPLKLVGLLALRRKDVDLFREICICWKNGKAIGYHGDVAKASLQIWTVWLHRIVKMDRPDMFNLLIEVVWLQLTEDRLSNEDVEYLLADWHKHAGSASLNPRSEIAAHILDFMCSIAEYKKETVLWEQAIRYVGAVIKLAIARREFEAVFPVFYPLLERGRQLFVLELKFGQYSDGFRQRILFTILQECTMLISYAMRQDFTVTSGDIIKQLGVCWVQHPQAGGHKKSIKKFCQFFLLFWMNKYRKQARKEEPFNKFLLEPMLLSEEEKNLFTFLKA